MKAITEKRRALIAAARAPRLPGAYQEIEYLELSSSNPCQQYIKTSILGNNKTIVVKYERMSAVGYSPIIISSIDGNNFTGQVPWAAADGTCSGASISPTTSPLNTPMVYNVVFGNSTYSIRIGGWSDDYWTAWGRYYSVEIFNGTVKIFQGVPCYRKSDHKPGMYDLVNNQFYTNAGTGEFTAGPDVTA